MQHSQQDPERERLGVCPRTSTNYRSTCAGIEHRFPDATIIYVPVKNLHKDNSMEDASRFWNDATVCSGPFRKRSDKIGV